jgi:hypothetical protein
MRMPHPRSLKKDKSMYYSDSIDPVNKGETQASQNKRNFNNRYSAALLENWDCLFNFFVTSLPKWGGRLNIPTAVSHTKKGPLVSFSFPQTTSTTRAVPQSSVKPVF